MKNIKSKFLKNVALNIAINGAFQRNSIYIKELKDHDKRLLRKDLRVALDKVYSAIQSTENYTDENHFQTIDQFSKEFSKSHKKLLNNKKLNIGTSQKLINLFWKMQWLFDVNSKVPIHCPFDNIIIKRIKELKNISWTKVTKLSDYEMMVRFARKQCEGYDSMALWKLEIYNTDIHETIEVPI